MSFRNTLLAYGSVSRFLHWLIFALVFIMLIYGFLLGNVPKPYQGIAYNIHKLTGVTILILMLLRAVWALMNPKPILPIGTPRFEVWAERIVHYALYILLIAMPLSGWIGSSAAGRSPHVGGTSFNLPVPHDKALIESSFDVHNTLSFIIIFVVSLHILAALYHHYIRRDEILRRMLP